MRPKGAEEDNMQERCSSYFENGKEIVDKVRMMGFSNLPTSVPLEITCANCEAGFLMMTMESVCPECNMVFAVTPCHSSSAENVMPAGIGY